MVTRYSNTLPCPLCGDRSKVLDTRPGTEITPRTRRRRKCFSCGHRWTTVEIDDEEWKRLVGFRQTVRDAL
jgi:transcriptional regulator NrdR family protein